MATEAVEERIREIRAASYGKEVREPIASVLEAIAEKVKESDTHGEEIENARGSFENVGGRMEADTERISSIGQSIGTQLEAVRQIINTEV